MRASAHLRATKKEDTFITRGFKNWKNATSLFRKHEESECHKQAVEHFMLPKQCGDIAESMQHGLRKEKETNRRMLAVIVRSVKYLARQGLALRGHLHNEGNFIQLLNMQAETDGELKAWLQKKQKKYLSGDIQNELLRLMAHSVLRDIVESVHNNVYYALMADEVTDLSNREQFVVCLRWVDHETFEVNEDLIGLYQVDDITSLTLYSTLKDVLLRLNLSIHNCRSQCFDGANNMVGVRGGVATLIQKDEPRATLVHCYGHSLQLAVGDTIKQIKLMADCLDITNEVSKLLKYSPKRDTLFEKLKKELAPEVPGFRVLCPTRWTVRANSLQSVIENYEPLLELWEECLRMSRLDSETKCRIVGVKHQMETFQYFYGISLGVLLMKHSDNLSKTLQHSYMSAVEGQSIASMTVKTLQLMRSDEQFDLFWSSVNEKAKALDIPEPTLTRKRKRQKRFEMGEAESHFPESPKSFYKSIYYNSLDTIINCIKNRFNQPGYEILCQMEALLMKAVNKKDFSSELDKVCKYYQSDLDSSLLKTHLQTLSASIRHTAEDATDGNQDVFTFKDLKSFMASLTVPQKSFLSQVIFVYKMILLAPATNAMSERSCSALRRTKTWLRTTMNQDRLNHCLILHTHQSRTDSLDLAKITSDFVEGNEHRVQSFT